MLNTTQITNSFTALVRARPVSHLAAMTLAGTSLFFVHEGADSVLPAGLTVATTAAMIGMEWLQWTTLGRIAKLEDARRFERASVLKLQALGVGCLQVILYTLAVVNFAREAGANWGEGWALLGAVAIAALYGALNFVVKWTSCDPVDAETSGGPTGGQRIHSAIFSMPALPAIASNDDNVVTFDLEKAIREKTARMEAAEASALQVAPPVRPAPVRLRNAAKRIRVRAKRAT